MSRLFVASFLTYAVLSAGIVGATFKVALETELAEDRTRGQARLLDSINRLNGQVEYYRALINLISQDPDVGSSYEWLSAAQTSERLARFSLTYGVSEIDRIESGGRVTASSNKENLGNLHPARIVRPAFNGRLGRANVLADGRRAIRMSRLIGPASSTRDSAIVMTIEMTDLEFDWPVSAEPIYYQDPAGGVLASNRAAFLDLGKPDGPILTKHKGVQDWVFVDAPLWDYAGGQFQMLDLPVPQLGLRAHILLSTERATQTATLRAQLGLATAIALGLIGYLFVQQRRRIALDAQHSATLEARVAARTSELRDAQAELVEASNLAALGRLSAGLSHEINQPLAAILNFAENGKQFLNRAKPDRAAENLGLIGDQVRRITRIISNLRAFARQEATPTDPVDFVAVTQAALTIAKPDLNRHGIIVETDIPTGPIIVIAGHVRLEQVILNLISNAQDAMADTTPKRLTIEMRQTQTTVQLHVTDTGHGVQSPDQVFEPFYTTKELGASKGLGMGLALSFGIVQSFGGHLECRDRDTGAEFIISLPLAGDP